MDLTTLDYIRISIGVSILLYVANCLVNQKVWIRKTFSWGDERGVSQDFPDEHYWGIIDWIIFGCKSFLVLTSSLPFMTQVK